MAKDKKVAEYVDTRGVVHKPVQETKGVDWKHSKGRPPHEMDTFDCPFSIELELEDFSKEFLIKLMHIWTKWYMTMPMLWWEEVRQRFGDEPANEIMINCFEKMADRGMGWIVPLLGPKYKTIKDIKILQDAAKLAMLAPDGGLEKTLFTATVEWEDENHAVATVHHCILQEHFESIGAWDVCGAICQNAEPRGTEAYFANPCARVKGIRVPPRKNVRPDETICCIWDYRMMDKPQPRGKDRKPELGEMPDADWHDRPTRLPS